MTKKFDLYEKVTDTIIKALENNVNPWRCPWNQSKYSTVFPKNLKTKKSYRGVNMPLLNIKMMENGYKSPYFVTFKQAVELGGKVKKGEKSTMVVYYNIMEKENKNDPDKKDKIPFLKYFNVFNVEQCEGLDIPPEIVEESPDQTWEDLNHVETVIKNTNADIRHAPQDRAYFRYTHDFIMVPEKTQFPNAGSYYATLLHELTHWTGHHSRLDRKFGSKFGDKDYAFEELVAEIGSAFSIASLGVDGEFQHDSYIKSWLKALKEDKKYIFKASSLARKAHEYIVSGVVELEEVA